MAPWNLLIIQKDNKRYKKLYISLGLKMKGTFEINYQ